jgi:hypothetical protein
LAVASGLESAVLRYRFARLLAAVERFEREPEQLKSRAI